MFVPTFIQDAWIAIILFIGIFENWSLADDQIRKYTGCIFNYVCMVHAISFEKRLKIL